jgi:hypothetical protein
MTNIDSHKDKLIYLLLCANTNWCFGTLMVTGSSEGADTATTRGEQSSHVSIIDSDDNDVHRVHLKGEMLICHE